MPELLEGKPDASAPLDRSGDPAGAFVRKFNDPSQWRIVPNVPIFDAHEEVSDEPEVDVNGDPVKDPATGKQRMVRKVEKFDRASLEQHAANCNKLVATGNPPGLTLGHTRDDGREESQPETVGYAKNFRVVYSPTLGRDVVVHDEYYDPEKFEAKDIRSFPFRSVERWKSGAFFKPIALLRREPRRNLGVVTYRRRGIDTVARYSMNYETENNMAEPMPPQAAPPAAPMPDAAAAPVADMEPSDKDKQLFAKLCKAYFADPANAEEVKKMMAGDSADAMPPADPSGAPPAEPVQQNAAGMAAPSGTNTGLPAMADTDKDKMSKNAAPSEDVVRYQKKLEDADRRIAGLEKESRVARYQAALSDLHREHVFDIAEELTEIQDYGTEAANRHFKRIKERYAKRPHGDRVRLADLDDPIKSGQPMSKEDMEKALKYQAEHKGVSIQEAYEKVGAGKVVRSA